MAKKTALYDTHIRYGGKMVEFTDYLLPIQYSSIIKEHLAVREEVGIFDVSHMGEVLITGDEALCTLNYIMSNDFTNMTKGQVRYSLMLNSDGTIIDDVLVYKNDDNSYLVVVNACNKSKDYNWIKDNSYGKATVIDMSDNFSQIALQGPKAEKVMSKLIDMRMLNDKYYTFTKDINLGGCNCIISRTGYTGEKGFEIYTNNQDAEKVFEMIMATKMVTPCGLGSRDTLRLEAAMPLYGHELSDKILASETGLDFAIKMNKDFIGRNALLNNSPKYKRVGVILIDRGIAREGSKVYYNDKEIGYVTSGTHSPLLNKSIAMLRILKDIESKELTIDVRGRKLKAEITSMPFNKR